MHAVLERVAGQIESGLGGLNAETAQLHPQGLAYRWNAHQVVAHLVLGYRLTSAALEARLKKGRLSANRKRSWLNWSLQIMILSFGKLPSGVPAQDETTPTPDQFGAMNGRQLGELLHAELERMDALLDQCRRKFGMERVARHPFLGPLRVDQWRRFHVVHGYHHLAQLRAVLQQVAPAPVPVQITSANLVKELQIPVQRPLA